jgi:mono/diheme cytochrome c family protein
MTMPRWLIPALLICGSLALVPFACVARSRAMRSPLPRVHLIPDMDQQRKFKSQQTNPLFADRRAMRAPVEGTVARGGLELDEHFYRGLERGGYTERFPLPVTKDLLQLGRENYDVFCAPCHGLAGGGDGMVARRADRLRQGAWVPPTSLHDPPASTRSVGHLFNSITNGIRNMPAYGSQIPVADRWAIVAYVRALQKSQHARLEEVPPGQRSGLQ